jgi:isopenicillin-N N-acyltransferase-like protein
LEERVRFQGEKCSVKKEEQEMKLEMLSFSGTHYDVGFQHGEKLSDIIRTSVIPFVREDMKDRGISDSEGERISRKYEELIGKLFPEVIEETRGLAEGVGIEYQTALLLLLFWEVRDTVSHVSHECTSFVAAGDATANGEPIAAQNSDWPMFMKGRNIGQVFHVNVKNGNKFIGRGLAGNLGRTSVIGFNEKGLSFVGSGIHQVQGAGFGFPPLIATRIGLERCSTVDEFIDLVRSIPEWSHAGENVDVVDSKGNMARISFSTRRIMTVQTKDHFVASSNHFHNREMRHFGPPTREDYPSSFARYDQMIELLKEHYGKIDKKIVMEIMSDHKYGDEPPDADRSICRHGEDRETMTSLISVPKDKEFWIYPGTPCKGDYTCFKL